MTLAIFDLDYTLLQGDSEWLWSEFLMQWGFVNEDFVEQIFRYYLEYEAGTLDFIAYQTFLLEPLTRLTFKRLSELRECYLLEVIRPRLRPLMLEQVDFHRTQAHTLLLITASNSFLAEPIARLLQFPHVICTSIETRNGLPTGKLSGTPAYRDGKVTRLQTWLQTFGVNLNNSWGYSDSHNDLLLLEQVAHPVAVTPDSKLLVHATQAGWKIIS